MKKPQWVKDAETMGLKWNELDRFSQMQFQRQYPYGRLMLQTPKQVLAYGRDRFDSFGKVRR